MTEQNTAETVPVAEAAVPAAAVPAAAVPAAAPKDRRKLFAALRWTAAVLVFAAVGAGVTYGITRPERTDIPGLSTRNDGRWTYPTLAKPALPAGAPLAQGPDNKAGTHYAPLTGLLLPAPEGAKPDEGVKTDKDGAVSVDAFLEEYAPDGRAKLKEVLEHEGLRQIAGRGWTMPDGTRTHVYLLRFPSEGFVDAWRGCNVNTQPAGAPVLEVDLSWREAEDAQPSPPRPIAGYAGGLDARQVNLYQEPRPAGGEEQTKLGCLQAGDVQGVIIQTRKSGVATVPFHQTVILQSQLLG
ncbi:hypothetical protein ACFC1D_16305 [Streptomyces vinaceus]|uniref:hypothetical protein n=1 Tax=Streptomyces vinaceus TaxID=1960 RepID=UPI0035DD393E